LHPSAVKPGIPQLMKSLIICLLGCILIHFPAAGQTPDMEQSLQYVNAELGTSFEVTVERGTLIVKYFQSGELFREDQALCKDLDPAKVLYSATDKVLAVNCLTGRDCVIRVYHIREIRRDYGRISFAKELDPGSASGLSRAFAHIIKMVNDTKYKESVTFE
jgi:hypothetical protein